MAVQGQQGQDRGGPDNRVGSQAGPDRPARTEDDLAGTEHDPASTEHGRARAERAKNMIARSLASWSEERVRRPADLLGAIFALAVVFVVVGSIHALPLGSTEVADDVSRWLLHIPRWLSSAAAVIAGIGSFVLAVVILVLLVRREWRDARNAGAALIAGAGAAIAVVAVWDAQHGVVAKAVLHGKNPEAFVVGTAFIALVTASDLVRRPHWSRWCVGLGAALLLTSLAVDTLTPFALVVSLFGGLFIGWLVRWAFGAASARPSPAELVPWLGRRGLELADLATSARGGYVRLEGTLTDGTPVEVRIADRDTRGSGLARRLWALARLRQAASGPLTLSSRTQLERLALASSLAQRSQVPGPEVLLLDQTPGQALVLVLTRPPGCGLGDAGGGTATKLFRALRGLHDTGTAHRDLRPQNLFADGHQAGFCSLDTAVPGASELARRLDLAQLLATLAQLTGPDEAVAALRAGYRPADETSVAAVLQPIALAPWGWSAMRRSQACLTEVRRQLLGPDAQVPPVRLERFRWRTVVSAIALTAAAYILVGQISSVNLFGTLRTVNFAWFAVAIAGSALTYLAAAENLAAFVPKRLSPVKGFLVQLSTAFIGVAMPPTVGHVAVNARYLHREGVDDGSISAAVALSQVVNVVTTVLLMVALGLLTGTGLSRFKIAPGPDVLIGLAVIAGVIGILLAIPRTRVKLSGVVWPYLRRVWPRLLEAVSQPLRLAASSGANLLLSAAYVLAFIASLRAVGAHPAILPAAVVYLAGNTVGSAAPTPGGLGAVEAVLAAGLTAMGVPAHDAIPGVLVFRVATFWLPIPAGYLSYQFYLHRKGIF